MDNSQLNLSKDARGDFRIKENKRVLWSIAGNGHSGQGRIRNISATGMLVELDKNFEPHDTCVLKFNSQLGSGNFIPEAGRLVWFRKTDPAKEKYLCGVNFVEPSEYISEQLKKRLDKEKFRSAKIKRFEPFLKYSFVAIFIALNGVMIWFSHGFRKDMTVFKVNMDGVTNQQATLAFGLNQELVHVKTQLEATRALYIENEALLHDVKHELEATKVLLDQSEVLLADANNQNSKLKQEVQDTKDTAQKQLAEIAEAKLKLENTIALLEEKNTQFAKEVGSLQSKLDYYSGNVKDMQEARSWLTSYRENLKLVKGKMQGFRIDAQRAHAEVLKEQDRVRLILGNNGYFIKNGEVVKVDMKKYQDAQGESHEQTTATPQSKEPVKINVTFVD